jgi:hypothetical protein
MKLISHRGNTNGPDLLTENTPKKIDFVISRGFDVEIDLWFLDNCFYLGHDDPKFMVGRSFLVDRAQRLWIHCKNINCLAELNKTDLNYFWHENDFATLTSHRYVWCHPKQLGNYSPNMVCLDFRPAVDFDFYRSKRIHALCCDYMKA